ncbi:MAG: PQQ-like beta-propeller repeat protein [Lentisphaeria bacterium]|nr:PQQ-like beta-propeller repeat protein [Lentisphaeria bacterium]
MKIKNIILYTLLIVPLLADAQLKHHADPKPISKNAKTEDLTDFLGNGRQPVSNETNLLKNLSNIKLVWEFEKGDSYTAPVIKGDKLIYAHAIKKKVHIECLNALNGKTIWRYSYTSEYKDQFGYGNGPRGSAVIDGDLVYMHGVAGKLLCLNLKDGKKVWSINTNKLYKVPQAFFGIASTPLVEGDLLIVNVGAPAGPCVVAFNKKTGKELWKTGNKWRASYASPIAVTLHGQRRLLVFAGGKTKPPVGGLMCINPKTAKIDFEYPWRSKKLESVNASTPIAFGNKVFISAAYQTGGTLLEIQKDFSYKVLWTTDKLNCHWMTPVQVGNYMYGISGRYSSRSTLVCINIKTGKAAWAEKLSWNEKLQNSEKEKPIGFNLGSIIKADGKFLCLSEQGHLLWLEMNETGYKILSKKRLFTANETWCSPVISKGILYLVQNTKDQLTGKSPRIKAYDLRQ